MFLSLRRTAAILFYLLGSVELLLVMLAQRGWSAVAPAIHSLDLPLIAVALLYGGMSFYASIHRPGKTSPVLAGIIALPLLALFAVFLLLNFSPMPPSAALP